MNETHTVSNLYLDLIIRTSKPDLSNTKDRQPSHYSADRTEILHFRPKFDSIIFDFFYNKTVSLNIILTSISHKKGFSKNISNLAILNSRLQGFPVEFSPSA